jgi:hypothetical protein
MAKEVILKTASTSQHWDSYLSNLPLSPRRLRQIRDVWSSLEQALNESLNRPYAALTPSGEFSMTWDNGRHHFEIDLRETTYDWFYMDRDSEDRAGEHDIPVGVHSPVMVPYLQRVAR